MKNIIDIPIRYSVNHFFDPTNSKFIDDSLCLIFYPDYHGETIENYLGQSISNNYLPIFFSDY